MEGAGGQFTGFFDAPDVLPILHFPNADVLVERDGKEKFICGRKGNVSDALSVSLDSDVKFGVRESIANTNISII